jgi:EmrB/QacA subfamily drug resistance transporter
MSDSIKNKTLLTLISVAIGSFMSQLDSGIVNVALPVIQDKLRVPMSSVEWVVTAYLLVVSGLLLIFGRLSDMIGHKTVYVTGFIIFTLGSLFCGISFNIQMLVISRVVQAVGAAMIFATGPAIVTNAVSEENRGKALSVSAVAVALALCLGPVLGGILTSILGWHSIFFINVPVGILGTLMAIKNIQKDIKKQYILFDIVGSIIFFTSLILVLLPLNCVGKGNVNIFQFCLTITIGIALFLLFTVFESKTAHPMFETQMFGNRIFAAGSIAALFNFMAQYILIILAPYYLENLRGFSTFHSGLLYLPMPISAMITAPISGILSDHFGSRTLTSVGMAVMSSGIFMFSTANMNTPIYYLIIAMSLIGVGFGMFQTPNNSAVMGSVLRENRGTACGMLATLKNVGMVLGAAISEALFSLNMNIAKSHYSSSGMGHATMQQVTFTYALHIALIVAGVVGLLAMGTSLMGFEK